MRRYAVIAGFAMFGLGMVWTGLWYYARTVVESQIDQVLAQDSAAPAALVCNDRYIGGFPFRMTLDCSAAGLAVRGDELSADLNGLHVVALAYNPRHVVAEFSAPLNVRWTAPDSPVRADWSNARASIRLSGQSLARLSVEFDEIAVESPFQSLAAARAQLHARPAGNVPETDLALSADDAEIGSDDQTSSPFSVTLAARIDAAPEELFANGLGDRDTAVRNLDFRLQAGESRISALGEILLSRNGAANGEIVVTIENLQALSAFLQTLPDAVRARTQTIVGGMIALGRPSTNGQGAPVSELTLSVRDNVIYAGTRQIGMLEPF